MADGCLLLLARADDPAIRTLRQQAPLRLSHARIADLSRAGWRYVSGRPDQATACVDGRVISADEIAAVVCRIPAIMPSDLPHVHRDDRVYVAAETNAFLRAWLAQFAGVRFNEPTWASLAGPAWHALQWTWLVANIGVPVVASAQAVIEAAHAELQTATATVVGGAVFGLTDPILINYSLRIARAVHSHLLAVQFVRDRDWKFLSADPCPELTSTSAAALLERAFARAPEREASIKPHAGVVWDAT